MNHTDYPVKSTAAFMCGVGIVTAVIAWETDGSLFPILVTAGIPVLIHGLLLFRQSSLRAQRLREAHHNYERETVSRRRRLVTLMMGRGVNRGFTKRVDLEAYSYPHIPRRPDKASLVLRSPEQKKQRILQGREPMLTDGEAQGNDQWHH